MNKKRLDLFRPLCFCLILSVSLCALSQENSDTSTAADWEINCALFQEYHNKLIFSAVETTAADGKRVVAWSAQNRTQFLSVFQRLVLAGVPALKKKRDLILAEAVNAPGGNRLTILPKLDGMISSFWKQIEAAALKHEIFCRPPKK